MSFQGKTDSAHVAASSFWAALRESPELLVFLALVVAALVWITAATVGSRTEPGVAGVMAVGPRATSSDYGRNPSLPSSVYGVQFDPAGQPTVEVVEVSGAQAPLRPEIAETIQRDPNLIEVVPRATASPTATR